MLLPGLLLGLWPHYSCAGDSLLDVGAELPTLQLHTSCYSAFLAISISTCTTWITAGSYSLQKSSTRRLEIAAANAEEADKLKKLITAVTQLSDELTSGHAVIHLPRSDDTLVEVQTTDYHYDFNFDATWSGVNQGRLFRAARLVIRDKSGHNVGSDYVVANGPDISLQKKLAPKQWDALTDSYFPPKTTDKLLGMVGPLRFRLERSSNNEAESKTDSGLHPEQWTYLDFFYFSTITQTTVGYGDILPNRSSVRMCVVIQVLLGLLLLGVAISWVTSGEDAATSQP